MSSEPESFEHVSQIIIGSNLGMYLGSLVMALGIDSICCGIAIHQFITWLSRAEKDRVLTKVLVVIAMLFGIITTVMAWAFVMDAFVFQYGTYGQFLEFKWYRWYTIPNITTVLAVEIFFAERAFKINQMSKKLLLLLLPVALCYVAAGIGFVVITKGKTLVAPPSLVRVFLYLWPGSCLVANFVIIGAIVRGLATRRTGWHHTDTVITKLIKLCFETQAPPTITILSFLILYTANPKTPLAPCFLIVHPKVYLLGFLAVLNLRHTWRQDGTAGPNGSSENHNIWSPVQGRTPMQATVEITQEIDSYVTGPDVLYSPIKSLNRQFSSSEKTGITSIDG